MLRRKRTPLPEGYSLPTLLGSDLVTLQFHGKRDSADVIKGMVLETVEIILDYQCGPNLIKEILTSREPFPARLEMRWKEEQTFLAWERINQLLLALKTEAGHESRKVGGLWKLGRPTAESKKMKPLVVLQSLGTQIRFDFSMVKPWCWASSLQNCKTINLCFVSSCIYGNLL